MPKVLIELTGGYGLGDAIQFTVVLKHLAKLRPDWLIDVRCNRGKHTALIGLCNRVWIDDEPTPTGYDTTILCPLRDNHAALEGVPNTKVTQTLREIFTLPYDPLLGRYECYRDKKSDARAAGFLSSANSANLQNIKKTVIVHYEGWSSPHRKDLSHWQARRIVEFIIAAGRIPVLIDWKHTSILPQEIARITQEGNWSASDLASLIDQCEAFVGIDSGPGHVAAATNTPSLVCWTKNHPVQFFDPAPNVTHLVPVLHRSMEPANHPRIGDFFVMYYHFATYQGECDMVAKVQEWLGDELKFHGPILPQTFAVQNDLSSAAWAMLKIQAIAGVGVPIEIVMPSTVHVDSSARPLLEALPFIQKIREVPGMVMKYLETNTRGRPLYPPEGQVASLDEVRVLNPDPVLEEGRPITEWLDQYEPRWDYVKELVLPEVQLPCAGPFVLIYRGPHWQKQRGPNRGELWAPEDWSNLETQLVNRGFLVSHVAVDCSANLQETLSLCRKATAIITYPCGLAVLAHYLGANVITWFRQAGDSQEPDRFFSVSEQMATSWLNPEYTDRYRACMYGRETPEEIAEIVQEWTHSTTLTS